MSAKGETAKDQELEAKLTAWPGFRLPDLAGIAGWIVPGEVREEELDARYVDAADLRLLRLGITLRHRTGGDDGEGRWTLKIPGSGSHDVMRRTELHEPGPPGEPPARFATAVAGVARGAALDVVAHLHTRRQLVPLGDPAGRPLAEVSDDEVTLLEGDRVAARFRELEVEAKEGAPEQLVGMVADYLRDAGAGPADQVPKLTRALGPRAEAPADPVVPSLGSHPVAGLLVQRAIASSVHRMLMNDPVVRLDLHDEGVHQMRVATRRLRSDLRTFGPLLDADTVDPIRDELKWLAALLGDVRDLDVLGTRFAKAVAALPEELQEDGAAVPARVARLREPCLVALHDALDSPRYLDLVDAVVLLARTPPLLEDAARPAADVATELASKPWRKLRTAVQELPDEPPDEMLHAVRIRAKRARYAVEAVLPVHPEAQRHAKAIAGVQEVLGDHQDSVVAEAWLRDAVEELSPRQAFVAGVLAARQRADADASRDKWVPAWKAADRKSTRKWLTS
jgi:CHAD domain-containing protein